MWLANAAHAQQPAATKQSDCDFLHFIIFEIAEGRDSGVEPTQEINILVDNGFDPGLARKFTGWVFKGALRHLAPDAAANTVQKKCIDKIGK